MQTNKRRVFLTIPEKIVLTGYYDGEDRISKLEPVKNWAVYSNTAYSEDADGNPQDTPLVACVTNSYGALRPVTKAFRGFATTGLVGLHKMVMPPGELFSRASTSFGCQKKNIDWQAWIGEAIRRNPELQEVAFQVKEVPFDLLREPRDIPSDGVDEDEGYRTWHGKIKNDRHGIRGIVIPKTRAVFFVVNSRYADAVLTIYINGKKSIGGPNDQFKVVRLAQFKNMYGYVLYGTDQTLPVGQYRVEVGVGKRPSSESQRWHTQTAESGSYTIIDYVRFPLKNHFTEMAVIDCNPISVEEALVNQFPEQYTHLMGRDTNSEGKTKKASSSGFHQLSAMLKRKKEIAGLAHGVAFSDSGTSLTFALGKALQESLKDTDPKNIAAMNLAFSTIKTWDNMKSFKETGTRLLAYADGTLETKTIKAALKSSYLGKGFLSTGADHERFETTVAARMSKQIFRFDLPKASQHILTPINRLMKPVEIASNLSALKHRVDDYSEASAGLKLSVKNYQYMVRDYFDKTFFVDQDAGEGGDTFFAEESMAQVFYGSDEFKTMGDHKGPMDAAVQYLLDYRDDVSRIVFVKGYTDSTASPEHNLELSFNRVSGVKQAIAGELKNRKEAGENIHLYALSERILTLGYGEKYAGQDTGDTAKKSENRRCDIHLGVGTWSQGGCRLGIENLEKMRKLTVANMLGMDEAQKKALLAICDAVLSVGTIVPVTSAPALFLVAAKELGTMGARLYDNAYTVVDNWMFDGLMSRTEDIKKDLIDFTKKSHGNTQLIMDEKRGDKQKISADEFIENIDLMDTNFRLRSEAVAGLFNLLYRAQLTANEKNGSDSKGTPLELVQHELKKNRVNEYITNFILNDGWSFPLESQERLAMAEYWQLAVNIKGVAQDESGELSCRYRDNFYLDKDFLLLGEDRQQDNPNAPMNALTTADENLELYAYNGSTRGGSPTIPFSYTIAYKLAQFDHLVSDFQKNFPVHTMDSMDVNMFSDVYAPIRAGEYGEDIYDYMNIYTRRRDQKGDDAWQPLAQRRSENALSRIHFPDGTPMGEECNFDPLTPFDRVRVIVVLKKEYEHACTASIQLHRGDENRRGIKYATIMRPLTNAELITEDEKMFEGRVGVVFEPFYQLAFQTVHGLKPMAGFSLNLMPVNMYEALGLLKDVPYYLTVVVAHAPSSKRVVCYPESHDDFKEMMKKNEGDNGKFLLTVDPDRSHVIDPAGLSVIEKKMFDEAKYEKNADGHYLVKDEALFLDKDFLNSLTTADAYPTLMEDDIHASILVKVGDSDWMNGHVLFRNEGKGSATLTLDAFSWDQTVEFMVVSSCKKVEKASKETYEKRGFNWKSFPATLTLFQDGTWGNIQGPMYQSPGNMQYLGFAKMTRDGIKFENQYADKMNKNSPFHELISWFTTPSQHTRAGALMEDWLVLGKKDGYSVDVNKEDYHFDWTKYGEERHLFAARFKMHYTSLKGAHVDGIRPFGKMKKSGDHYTYFMEVSTPDKSGLQGKRCGKNVMNMGGSTFEFPAPDAGYYKDDKAPWNRPCGQGETPIPEEETMSVEEWITDYREVIKPVRRVGSMDVADQN